MSTKIVSVKVRPLSCQISDIEAEDQHEITLYLTTLPIARTAV